MSLVKDRDISIEEWFYNLQMEYLSYKVRSFLYRSNFDKKKFTDISDMKADKIKRFNNPLNKVNNPNIPSMFTDERIKKQYIGDFFNEWGLPCFKYRDEYKKQVQYKWDRVYYFNKGKNVKIKTDEGSVLGVIVNYDVDTDIVEVLHNNQNIYTPSYCVSRIFSENFFNSLL